MKNKALYKIGLLCGLTTLTVGLFIFFIWWTARTQFAVDLYQLEGYGFLWSILSFFIAGIGLLLMIIVLIINAPKYLTKNIVGLIIILANIPAFYGVLVVQAELEKRAYVKFENKTSQDNLTLLLSTSSFDKQLGQLDNNDNYVRYFYPKYLNHRSESVPVVDPVRLTIKSKDIEKTINLRDIYIGECTTIIINKDLEIEEK